MFAVPTAFYDRYVGLGAAGEPLHPSRDRLGRAVSGGGWLAVSGRELASLAVVAANKGQGIGSALVRALLATESGTVYLTCADRLEGYYTRFGFRRLEPVEMPPYFRRLSRLTRALSAILRIFGRHWRILVMVRKQGIGVRFCATQETGGNGEDGRSRSLD